MVIFHSYVSLPEGSLGYVLQFREMFGPWLKQCGSICQKEMANSMGRRMTIQLGLAQASRSATRQLTYQIWMDYPLAVQRRCGKPQF
jgi:hypothetical protein